MDFMEEGVDDYLDQTCDDLLSADVPSDELLTEEVETKKKTYFQKEIRFNKLLPYESEIENEADILLAKIKANLGRCVMTRELKPGCIIATNMLHKYIILYDLRFTKEDHILLIKLLFNLVTIPKLESSLVSAIGYRLYMLLRKSNLISPEELELPWRPLYDLCFHIISRPSQITTYHHPSSLENLLESLVHASKVYFPLSATQEILDELRPQICPFHNVMSTTMKSFELFLPVQLNPQHHSLGHELWFHEFMKLWETCSSTVYTWGNSIMNLISKLAYNNIGYIDWEPYIPLMFTRFVQSFNLPVCYKKIKCNSNRIGPYHIGLWIASVLGNNSSAQTYLEKFLKTIETYFQPANYGSWLKKLGVLYVNISHFVVLRIYRERHQTKTWKAPTPESHKLTETDIDAFVTSMIPIAVIGIFNKHCSEIFMSAVHYLAIMRPNLVIPKVLEKIGPTFCTDAEPQKVIPDMMSLIAISRPLIQGSRIPNKEYAFEEGPSHVLPLLFASLSAIDPNDPKKTFIAFRLISTYVVMVPVTDCSKSTAEMNEDERLVCEESSRFEDFILQFMDKVFVWIDSSSVESVRLENNTNGNGRSRSEAMAETAIGQIFSTLLRQTSHSIFNSALNKLRSFILEHVLETQVAGPLVAALCKVFSNVNSHNTLKALFPFLSEKVLDVIGEGDDVLKAENLDSQLLYPLLLLNRLVLTRGDALLPYMDTLLKVLDKVLQLKSLEGNQLACFTLSNVLQSLSNVMYINVERNLDDPEYPYVRNWGETVKIKLTKVNTYTPGEEELAMLQKIFLRYFLPTIESIENYINTEHSLSRDDLQVKLRIILNILDGCDTALPFWDEPPLKIKPYENCLVSFNPILGCNGEVKMPDGGNVRCFLVEIMTKLQKTMLKNIEDDTKSFNILQLIWQRILLGKLRMPTDSNFKFSANHYISKRIVENKMFGDNGWFPLLILTCVISQHQMRKLCTTPVFTETHKRILLNLMTLSTSHYTRIRIRVQEKIQLALGYFPNAYSVLTPYIIDVLKKDTTVNHDAYKGILYLITRKINDQESLLVKQDWSFIKELWPALVQSEPSEKSSVIRLKDNILNSVIECFYTTNLKLEISDECVSLAANLWNSSSTPNLPKPTEQEVIDGKQNLAIAGENNVKIYNEILDILLNILLKNNLHWRHRLIAMNFIYVLIHPEQILPPQIVRFFLETLIHESIEERKIALRVLMYVFKQLKKQHPKVKIEVPAINGKVNGISEIQPGCRDDNAWLQYRHETRPKTAAEWNEPRYVHKTYIGYYTWPRELEVYVPCTEQIEKSQQDLEVEHFFSEPQNVDKLIKYLSLEGKKNNEKFSLGRLLLFKGLFRNHGDQFLDLFIPRLQELVAEKEASSQRCAAEIVCGLIKGSKHWPYDMTQTMWTKLLPVLRGAFANLTVETVKHWALCIVNACSDRDPRRVHWLLECLMEESPLGSSEASHIECARLIILEGALILHSWRVRELLRRLLMRLESRIESCPFQNVRNCLASTLVTVFRINLRLGDGSQDVKSFPEAHDFVDKLYPRLQSLVEEDETEVLVESVANVSIENKEEELSTNSLSSNTVDVKRENNVRLFKIVCKWILDTVILSSLDSLSSFYKIYPLMCQLENNDKDEELSEICSRTIAVLAQTLTLPEHVPAVLEAVRTVSESPSWSARSCCLEFLQVHVFHNMSILLSDKSWMQSIQCIVMRLLEDEQVEVRKKAAQVLCGLLHCDIIPDQESLLDEFKKKAKTKIGGKRNRLTNSEKELVNNTKLINAARIRHAGVLGMCAFIQAHPYDVPKHVPPIFECLSSNLNDPEPIPSTIRKTVNDFKRTHCGGWKSLQGLAENFTEEQLAVIQDFTVLPSYYA